MRRLTLIVSLTVLMALAVAAAASAATLSATGNLSYRMVYGQIESSSNDKMEFYSQWRHYTYLDYRQTRGDVSAFVRYRLRTSSSWSNMNGTGDSWVSPLDSRLFEGWLEFKGSMFPAAPSGTLRIGRFETNQNPWIANFTRRDGILYSGLKLGPATVNLYHGWKGSFDSTVSMIRATGKVDIVDLTGVYVAHTDHSDKEKSSADFLVAATATPIKDLKVSAEIANNGASKDSGEDSKLAWKVNGELSSIPNFKLRASTWSTDPDFNGAHRQNKNVEKLQMDRTHQSRPIAYGDPWMQNGFSVGVTTTQAGLPFDVDVKMGKIFESGNNVPATPATLDLRGENMTVVSVGTTVAQVKADLAVTLISDLDPVIDIVASRDVKVSAIAPGNINLKGTVRVQESETNYAADAVWSAPNGLRIGLHYANYDRGTDWNHSFSSNDLSEGFDIGEKNGEADGFAITVGYSMSL